MQGVDQIVVDFSNGSYSVVIPEALQQAGLSVVPSISSRRVCKTFSAIDGGLPILQFTPPQAQRPFFHIYQGQAFAGVVAERCMPFEGAPNFRDYGGYRTADGHRIRWGKLYRSGQLAELTEPDQAYLAGLDIRLVCDFRQLSEQQREPSLFPDHAMPQLLRLPITPGSFDELFADVAKGLVKPAQIAEFMCEINREFALEQGEIYSAMFRQLIELPEGSSLVHCAAGKDRTGFAVAMVLAALGVSRELIFEDYLLTVQYFSVDAELNRIAKKYQWQGAEDLLRPMLEVRRSYLSSAFTAIDENFASLEVYLKEVLGVSEEDRRILQAHYLQS